jgi:histidinol-phosphate aminotransferase
MRDLLRPTIEGITEYTLEHRKCRIKLNQNENPFDLPDEIRNEVLRRVAETHWSRYPEFVPRRQMEKIAEFTGWTADGVLLGNGSNDLLQLLFTCTLDAGRGVVISQPTFTLYRLLAETIGAPVCDVPMTQSLTLDTGAVIDAANATGAAMLVLCSPNNPTGGQIPLEELDRILRETGALVVVDEAYVQFAGTSAVGLLKRYERLIVLQTFSKAMGAAGLRFGYALLSPHLARQLTKVKLPYSVNIFTLIAAEVFIERWDSLKSWIGVLVSERERIFSALGAMDGIRPYASDANFLLFETLRKTPAEVFSALLSRGILIRDVSRYPMLERGLRVSVGTPAENDEFIDALRGAV